MLHSFQTYSSLLAEDCVVVRLLASLMMVLLLLESVEGGVAARVLRVKHDVLV